MGNLSTEELFISPLASLVIFVVVMIFLEYGSRFFNRMQEVPSLEWKVLELFRGDLLDVLTRREALPRGLGLGGVRSLHMLAAEEDPSMQSRAASAIASLLHLAATVTEAQPDEQLRALAALTGKYTLGSRAHAAIGVAAAALNEARCPLLEQSGALRGVVELSHVPDPEVQGAAALAVALLAQSEPTRASMLHQGGLLAIQALLRSAHPDAMRCAACALAAVATEPDAPRHVARVFAPRLLVMLLRSRDPFLQAVGSMAIGALADADPSVRLRLLQSNALRPLAAIVRNSRSSVARFEACHALGCLAARADEVMHADSQERAIRAFSHAIASFSSGTLRPSRLQELHAALHTKPREELMAYYRHRPELARYTVAHELSRMEYHATTFNGTELEGAEAVGAFHASLDEKGQRGMLWRLANQSVLSDVIEAMHLHGYVDMELGASLRATSVRRLRSQRAPTARHRTLPHAAARCRLRVPSHAARRRASPARPLRSKRAGRRRSGGDASRRTTRFAAPSRPPATSAPGVLHRCASTSTFSARACASPPSLEYSYPHPRHRRVPRASRPTWVALRRAPPVRRAPPALPAAVVTAKAAAAVAAMKSAVAVGQRVAMAMCAPRATPCCWCDCSHTARCSWASWTMRTRKTRSRLCSGPARQHRVMAERGMVWLRLPSPHMLKRYTTPRLTRAPSTAVPQLRWPRGWLLARRLWRCPQVTCAISCVPPGDSRSSIGAPSARLLACSRCATSMRLWRSSPLACAACELARSMRRPTS